ncbi:hypothetical protein CHLNCDRAFT_135755 [Chlorella variabilis]|uniref:C2 domain-containing protein n=1 Tax=Chlorella variabilis TaxID=554065 RepID=E1ZIX9_CHLVA|nr:hypothetical protein CHLNCDRAFT_135755 [Chlorella variabilis]EFN54236.1 hypothetical protein CHLNCDRAFT_135755 [Chlorella variabilis]|eukprot:XP_005846338.1 hypothetical protein CHLNCDRAFT_135755 [Chlorella variabilis]
MQGRAQRRLVVTVRAAADIGASTTSPYVVLELGGTTLETAVALGGDNPVWDEAIELRLPPPLPNEQPLQIRVRVMSRVRLCPDRFIASGTTTLGDLLYGGGQHEATVQLTDKAGKPAGHLHLGLLLVKEGAPGEEIGSAAGTVLGSVPGGGPASPSAAAMPGPMLPSTATAEMQAREVLGAGNTMDPSKPGYGLLTG